MMDVMDNKYSDDHISDFVGNHRSCDLDDHSDIVTTPLEKKLVVVGT